MSGSSGVLSELGARPIINACGTVTVLGGTVISLEVSKAWTEASKVYLDMNQLHVKAGEFIARLTGAEAACVTTGTAASLVISVAACMTEGETQKMLQLPRSDGMRNEVIIQKLHRNEFDFVFKIAGANIIEIGGDHGTTPQQLEDAICERTAAVAYFAFDPQEGVLPLERVLEISHDRGVPVIVDAAAEIPPAQNLRKFTRMGSDLVLFSTGKDIGAPNDTGIILGRHRLVETCMRLGPHSREIVNSKPVDYIGRPMKTGKEDILAAVVALRNYFSTDHDRRQKEWEKKIQYLISELSKCDRVRVKRVQPSYDHPRPVSIRRVELEFRDRFIADELSGKLRAGDPPIYAYVMRGKLYLNPQCLRRGEEKIIASRIAEILST